MRKLVFCLLVVLLCSGTSLAKLSVSPVIIEAVNVAQGHSFEIICQHLGPESLEVELSLALFDQDGAGRVVFLEDQASITRARDVLNLESENLFLEPNQQQAVSVQVTRDDFEHLYAVLFVKPKQAGIPTRLAVLFLLSTTDGATELNISSWEHKAGTLSLTVLNSGASHGLWEGELLYFDAEGQLGKTVAVQSGIVLAGRSRGLEVELPPWVRRIEISSDPRGVRP